MTASGPACSLHDAQGRLVDRQVADATLAGGDGVPVGGSTGAGPSESGRVRWRRTLLRIRSGRIAPGAEMLEADDQVVRIGNLSGRWRQRPAAPGAETSVFR